MQCQWMCLAQELHTMTQSQENPFVLRDKANEASSWLR